MPANITHSPTGNAQLDKSLEGIKAREDRLYAVAVARGLPDEDMHAFSILRDAAGLLDLMSEGIAGGIAFDGPQMALAFQHATARLVELNGMLPEEFQGDLDAECFHRTGAADAVAGEVEATARAGIRH